jgi:hypothetical protein
VNRLKKDRMKRKIAGTALAAAVTFLLIAATALAKPAPFYDASTTGANSCSGPFNTSGGTFGTASANANTGTLRVRLHGVTPATYSVFYYETISGSCSFAAHGVGNVTTNARGNGAETFSVTFSPNTTAVTVWATFNTTAYITTPIAF